MFRPHGLDTRALQIVESCNPRMENMEKVWRKHRQHGDYGEHVNDRKHQPDDLTLFAPAYLSALFQTYDWEKSSLSNPLVRVFAEIYANTW